MKFRTFRYTDLRFKFCRGIEFTVNFEKYLVVIFNLDIRLMKNVNSEINISHLFYL